MKSSVEAAHHHLFIYTSSIVKMRHNCSFIMRFKGELNKWSAKPH